MDAAAEQLQKLQLLITKLDRQLLEAQLTSREVQASIHHLHVSIATAGHVAAAELPQPSLPDFYTTSEVAGMLGVSRMTLHRMRKLDGFPKPISISARRIGWPATVISDWVAKSST